MWALNPKSRAAQPVGEMLPLLGPNLAKGAMQVRRETLGPGQLAGLWAGHDEGGGTP